MSTTARIIDTATTTTVDAQPVVMVRVTAPSSLEGGYTFDAVYNGEVFPVTVLEGGVKAGQTFEVPFLDQPQLQLESPPLHQQQQQPSSEWTPMLPPQQQSQSPQHSTRQEQHQQGQQQAPLGTWKTYWFDCLSEGICHPSFCNAVWFPQILMGQVWTRMKLGSAYKYSTCIWMILTILMMMMMYAISRVQNCITITITDPSNYSVWGDIISDDDDDKNSTESVPIRNHDIGSNCTSDDADTLQTITWVWFLVTVVVLARLRRAVRKQHGISRHFPCEDLVCAAACQCCTISQLARQTANYKEQRAYCCTNTGLAASGGGWFGGRQKEPERRHVHLLHAHGCDHDHDQDYNSHGHSHTHNETQNDGQQIV